jgi:hypothetical protein
MPEYRLLQPYRIDKKLQPIGAEVELPAQVGDWLVSQSMAERVDGAVVTPRAPIAQPFARPKFAAPLSTRWSCCGPRKK